MTDQQQPEPTLPPYEFVQAESGVDGVDVFVPKEETVEQQSETVAFSCPNCLTKTAYSAKDRGLTCTSCGYFEPLDTETTDPDQLKKFPFDMAFYQQAAHGWGGVRDEIECQNCYAKISLDEGQLTTRCPFCASQKVVHHKASHDELRPLSVIPFTKTIEDITPSVSNWLGNSWMLPNELRRSAAMKRFVGIYLPFWIIDADVKGKWKAEFAVKVDSGVPTKWEWKSGSFSERFANFIVTGTKHVTSGLLDNIADYNLTLLQPYNPSYLVGWQAQAYESTLEEAHQEAREQIRFELQDDVRRRAQQSHKTYMRNFQFGTNYENEGWRYILLPVYLSAYTFRDKTYQVVVNGQIGSVSGSRPVNWFVVYTVMVAAFIPALLVCCAITGLVSVADEIDAGICLIPVGVAAICAFVALRTHTIARRIVNPDDRQKSDIEQYFEGMVPWELE